MTVFDWPSVLRARGCTFDPRGMTVAGSPTLSGRTQVASYDAGYWIATIDLATLDAGAEIKTFRALRAQMEGGAHHLRVPVFDEGQAPWPSATHSAAATGFTDGTQFSDGTGFAEKAIKVALAADAAARATSISVSVTSAATIAGGEYFSIRDRLHVVREVLSATAWAIWPPLREAAVSGRALNLDAPICRMRLASEQEMSLALGRLWRAQPSAAFIEVI